ncbi:MAG: phage portal protein [Acidobacteria bacterium]|nr:phage portal protein [Acidobacteriota bacterium]
MSRVQTTIRFGGNTYGAEYSTLAGLYWAQGKTREIMDLQRIYYLNNGLYDTLRSALYSVAAQAANLSALRNPAYRVVEFYAAKVWPGMLPDALPIELLEGANPNIEARIWDIWAWSNWNARKQVMVRWQAIYGNSFIKVAGDRQRKQVILQCIDPRHVVALDLDDRDAVAYIRIDTPMKRRNDKGEEETYTHTEIWDKAADRLLVYEHQRGWGVTTLPAPILERSMLEQTGVDFVPVVHTKHKDVGEDLGVGAFQLQMDKIDEVNRMTTRLHEIIFRHNKPLWAAMANMVDASGRPMPAPRLANETTDGELALSENEILRLPGLSKIEALVPSLNFADHLAVVDAQMQELQRDLPELAYYELRGADLSGTAIDLLLTDAKDRLLEARGNAESGLVRAQQMALSIGQAMGLPGFSKAEIGTYATGAFDHRFGMREALPMTELQRMNVVQAGVNAGLALATAMRRAGYTEDQVERALSERAEDRQRSFDEARAYLVQQRAIDGAGVYEDGEQTA